MKLCKWMSQPHFVIAYTLFFHAIFTVDTFDTAPAMLELDYIIAQSPLKSLQDNAVYVCPKLSHPQRCS
jgi:hypothetical protein